MTKISKSLSAVLSFVIVFCMLIAGRTAQAASYKTVSGNYNYTYASEVLTLVNNERASAGLKPVTMTQSLTDGAMLRAAETAVSFSHTRPNGEQCFTAFEWMRAAGENIAYGQRSPEQVMNGWMNSSGHRANILNSAFTTIGIGCFEYNGTLYWAQAFSGGSGSAYYPSGKRAVSVDVSLTAGVTSTVHYSQSSSPQTTTSKQTTTRKQSQTTETTTKKQTTTQKQTTKQTTTKKSSYSGKNVYSRIRYYIRYYFRY